MVCYTGSIVERWLDECGHEFIETPPPPDGWYPGTSEAFPLIHQVTNALGKKQETQA